MSGPVWIVVLVSICIYTCLFGITTCQIGSKGGFVDFTTIGDAVSISPFGQRKMTKDVLPPELSSRDVSLAAQRRKDSGLARWKCVQASSQPEWVSRVPSTSTIELEMPITALKRSINACSCAMSTSSANLYRGLPMIDAFLREAGRIRIE